MAAVLIRAGMSESGLSVVGWLQVTAASLLGLRFQLDEIAYGASNFRHADLSISELQAIMAAKQENFSRCLSPWPLLTGQ